MMAVVTDLNNYQNNNIKQQALEQFITHDKSKRYNNIKTKNIKELNVSIKNKTIKKSCPICMS